MVEDVAYGRQKATQKETEGPSSKDASKFKFLRAHRIR